MDALAHAAGTSEQQGVVPPPALSSTAACSTVDSDPSAASVDDGVALDSAESAEAALLSLPPLQVDVCVLGLYIPGQSFPNIQANFKLGPKRIKNVVVKPFSFCCSRLTTVRQLLLSTMERSCMAQTKKWFQSLDDSDNLEELYLLHFEPYARFVKTLPPQFYLEETDDPQKKQKAAEHKRFAYQHLLSWDEPLDDIRRRMYPNQEYLHISFAIWQDHKETTAVTPLRIMDVIRGAVLPDRELLQSALLESGRWKQNDDVDGYLEAAASIVRARQLPPLCFCNSLNRYVIPSCGTLRNCLPKILKMNQQRSPAQALLQQCKSRCRHHHRPCVICIRQLKL
jgi:hypothetical protein